MTRLELAGRLTGEYGQPLAIPPWWRGAFEALDDPAIREILLSLPRQSGKSQCLAALAITELLLRPNAYVVMAAASETQAGAIYGRKIKKPLERMLQLRGAQSPWRKHVRITKRGIELSTGAALEVIATSETTSPGRSPTLLLLDEARDIRDEFYGAFVPSVIGAGGKVVIASTAGPPRGFFYELVRHPSPETWLHHASTNDNPHADRGMMNFLERRLSVILPAAARRELRNEFTDDGTEFLPAPLIDAAVDFADVRADLDMLPQRFPNLCAVLIDEGAEAGALLPFARGRAPLALVTKGFIATPEHNMKLWGALAARLHAGTLSIPAHERLIAELRGLRQEQFAFGGRWRVLDSSRKFHRDVSLTVAGACFAVEEVLASIPDLDASPERLGGLPVREIGSNFLEDELFQ